MELGMKQVYQAIHLPASALAATDPCSQDSELEVTVPPIKDMQVHAQADEGLGGYDGDRLHAHFISKF